MRTRLATSASLERRRWFVHDDEAGLHRQRAGDLDKLLLSDRKIAHLCHWIALEPDALGDGLRLLRHAPPADEQLRTGFAANEHVLGDRHVRSEGELLSNTPWRCRRRPGRRCCWRTIVLLAGIRKPSPCQSPKGLSAASKADGTERAAKRTSPNTDLYVVPPGLRCWTPADYTADRRVCGIGGTRGRGAEPMRSAAPRPEPLE